MKIDVILFDLDDTIYPNSSGIWTMIRERIDTYMISRLGYLEENVHSIREDFFRRFGTTLRGLEATHQIDPVEYLQFVHDIPLENKLKPNHRLVEMLTQLPQKKVIFTNGDRWHAKRVTDKLQITHFFDRVIDVLDISPYCKPMVEAFNIALDLLQIENPARILLIDDNLRNVQKANDIGLNSIWLTDNQEFTDHELNKLSLLEDLLLIYPEIGSH